MCGTFSRVSCHRTGRPSRPEGVAICVDLSSRISHIAMACPTSGARRIWGNRCLILKTGQSTPGMPSWSIPGNFPVAPPPWFLGGLCASVHCCAETPVRGRELRASRAPGSRRRPKALLWGFCFRFPVVGVRWRLWLLRFRIETAQDLYLNWSSTQRPARWGYTKIHPGLNQLPLLSFSLTRLIQPA